MSKIDQVIQSLKRGPKPIDKLRADVPKLHGRLLDAAIREGIIQVTNGLFHLPNVEVLTVSVEDAVNNLNQRLTAVEKIVLPNDNS